MPPAFEFPPEPVPIKPPRNWGLIALVAGAVLLLIAAPVIYIKISRQRATDVNYAKAKKEMQAIRDALEEFKKDNGNYPPADNDQGDGSPYAEQNLLMALTGHARWTTDNEGSPLWETVRLSQKLNDGSRLLAGDRYTWGKAYIDSSKFLVDQDVTTASGLARDAVLHDPWWNGEAGKNTYLYRYKSRDEAIQAGLRSWRSATYLLVSRGADGLPADPEANFVYKSMGLGKNIHTGVLDPDAAKGNPELADNVQVQGKLPPR